MNLPVNALILQLPRAARHRLLDKCELFELDTPHELGGQGWPLSHAYFPNQGFFSLVADIDQHRCLAIGMAGSETVLGGDLILGATRPALRALVQQPCSGWCISAADLRQQSTTSPALERLLQASLLVQLHQQALAAACQRYHLLAPRLARWILMSRDRSFSAGSFHASQQSMAQMLGVRRVSVTNAASQFQAEGLITYHRGELTVRNRKALEARACSCYATDKRIYAQIIGTAPGRR
ncbi:Crp/Fnr family transcriptional regulator [Comamonas testosteroni]|uniref:Putative transcriptional regulator, Crp/Fnr family n=1 Tax=Comamonas testosteroni (strain DSM 14576 / KF-1) TaxID=399795 RepID=B7WXA9_COMTK|nr:MULTISPECIES: Crp/Fnr family transcriptional regulator [Comamonas]EED65932.1 putative transcriptional regulator, Crp/Fnr family [Comamonas testosteroni KF-1]TYK68020.1 Crp/Fnr family transcriptional regulator [Comamonas sp. Z3]WQG69321.1 Crp/Fnr family transcriptional regulator [Comamonas testosteroni]